MLKVMQSHSQITRRSRFWGVALVAFILFTLMLIANARLSLSAPPLQASTVHPFGGNAVALDVRQFAESPDGDGSANLPKLWVPGVHVNWDN